MKTIFLTTMIVLLTTFFSAFNVCQAQNPYGEVNFIKTLPNMSESFLIDMKTSKKLQNGRVANKTITSWQFYRRAYPRGSSMDYNYATLSVFPSGIEMKAEGTWDAPVRELSVKEISDYLTSLSNTPVSYTHLRAHETVLDLVCRLLLEKKKHTKKKKQKKLKSYKITE